MDGHSLISTEVIARYAADAAREVSGVGGVVDGPLPMQKGIRVTLDGDAVSIELHVALDWGANAPDVGKAVRARVAEYLSRMTDLEPRSVDVVVAGVGAPPPRG